jgi:hypothetical protein
LAQKGGFLVKGEFCDNGGGLGQWKVREQPRWGAVIALQQAVNCLVLRKSFFIDVKIFKSEHKKP